MPKFFDAMDRVRPVYDWVYKIVMVICKLLLIADILITSYAVAGRLIGGIQLPDGRCAMWCSSWTTPPGRRKWC